MTELEYLKEKIDLIEGICESQNKLMFNMDSRIRINVEVSESQKEYILTLNKKIEDLKLHQISKNILKDIKE